MNGPVTSRQHASTNVDSFTYPPFSLAGRASYCGQVKTEVRSRSSNEAKQPAGSSLPVPHGVGTLRFHDGSVYQGDLRDGLRFGSGVQTYSDGSSYTGDWADDIPNGRGRSRKPGSRGSGSASSSRASLRSRDSTSSSSSSSCVRVEEGGSMAVYEGEFCNGLRHGRGVLVWPQKGGFYRGEFRGDVIGGHGWHSFSNGDYYVGLWEDGQHSGYGCQYWQNKQCWFEGYVSKGDSNAKGLTKFGIYFWERPRRKEPLDYVTLVKEIMSTNISSVVPYCSEPPYRDLPEMIPKMPVSLKDRVEPIKPVAPTSHAKPNVESESTQKKIIHDHLDQSNCTFSNIKDGSDQSKLDAVTPSNISAFVETVLSARKSALDAITGNISGNPLSFEQVMEMAFGSIQDAMIAAEDAESVREKIEAAEGENRIRSLNSLHERISHDEYQDMSIRELRKACDKAGILWFVPSHMSKQIIPPSPSPSPSRSQSIYASNITLNETLQSTNQLNSESSRTHAEPKCPVLFERDRLVSLLEESNRALPPRLGSIGFLGAENSKSDFGKDNSEANTSAESGLSKSTSASRNIAGAKKKQK